MNPVDFAKILFRGMGQIMLQNNVLTGLLFLIGILVNSWVMFVGAVLGVLVGTLAAIMLKYEKKDIENGLYGFNGALVGCALFFFLVPDAVVLLLVIAGAILSALVMNYMLKMKLVPYTAPFVLSAWCMLAFAALTGFIAFNSLGAGVAATLDVLSSLSMGFGQVMFQGNVITGVVFLAAIAVNSRRAAAYALFGCAIGVLVALALSFPLSSINAGIFGYNGVLAAIALSDGKKNALLFAGAAAALSSLVLFAFIAAGIPALTAPFVLASWGTLALLKKPVLL